MRASASPDDSGRGRDVKMRLNLVVPNERADARLAASVSLAGLEDRTFGNAALGLRHPSSVYGRSLQNVEDKLTKLLDAIGRSSSSDGADEAIWSEPVAGTLQALLYASTEHFEDCQNVVKIIVGAFDQNLKNEALRRYIATVREARDFSARQTNAIKHQQGRIRFIEFEDPLRRINGYYIEGIDADGSVGPSSDVHGNSHTAFSIGRSIRYIAASFIFASQALAAFVSTHLHLPSPQQSAGLGPFVESFDRIAAYDRGVFPDEGAITCPAFVRSATSRAVMFPGESIKWRRPTATARIHLSCTHDALAPTHRMPYMGERWLEPKGRRTTRQQRR